MAKQENVNSTSQNRLRNSPHEHAKTLFTSVFIDDDGREIPITEQMILDACHNLEATSSSVYSTMSKARFSSNP